ncbi:MAG: 16S rRNA processing protein RimM [Clostridiales bacterium]|nr:16S rRNA processing protein RimM [Clostridiales bacterium]
MKLIETGKIVTTHGVRGEVRAEVWGDGPEALLAVEAFYRADGSPLQVEYSRVHRGALNLKLAGYDDIDRAMALIGTVLYLDRESFELPEGTYFVRDLIGLLVLDRDTGETYGRIVQVQPTGANDVYHIEAEDGRLLLVPAIAQVVASVDLAAAEMRITPLKGLFDP